jgi:hypothetical protein
MFGRVFVLNSNPAGVCKTSVPPVAMSPRLLLGSAIRMSPSDVQLGVGLFAAVSAEIAVPPVAAVTVTAASQTA